jgi:hypothetical protein
LAESISVRIALYNLLALEVIFQGLAPVAQLRAPQGGEDAVCGPRRRERVLRARDGDDLDLDAGE